MKYEIKAENFPVAICKLTAGEAVMCQAGAMAWMSDGIKMETKTGGLGKMVGRAFSGESLFQNRYVAETDGEIAFAANSPGEIRAVNISPGHSIVAQKGSYLASDEGVDMSVFFQKKIGAGFFGGEGLFNTVVTGPGRP